MDRRTDKGDIAMLEYIKEIGFYKFALMMIGAAVVDIIFIAILWIVP